MAVKKDQVLSQTANLQQGIINNNPVRFNEEHYDVDRDPTDNKRPLSTSAGDSPGTGGVDINSLGLDKKADLINGKVPESQLPSYVDDVLEYADSSAFPAEGEQGKIYVALDTNITYRWSGSAYVQVGPEGDIVLANPTLAGTEDELTGLQVGNTKYKVPGGGGSGDKLYQHCTRFSYAGQRNIYVYFEFINTSNSMTASEVLTYVSNLTSSGQHNVYPVCGTVQDTDVYPIAYCKFLSSKFTVYYVKSSVTYTKDFTLDDVTYDDVVTQIANTINVAPSVELYRHDILLTQRQNSNMHLNLTIINTKSTPYSYELWGNMLDDLLNGNETVNIECSGYAEVNNKLGIWTGIYLTSSNRDVFGFRGVQYDSANNSLVRYVANTTKLIFDSLEDNVSKIL